MSDRLKILRKELENQEKNQNQKNPAGPTSPGPDSAKAPGRPARNARAGGMGPGGGHGPGGMMAPGEKPKNFKGSAIKLVRFLKPYWFAIILVLFFAVGSTVFTIIGPKMLGQATDRLIEGLTAKMSQIAGAAIDFQYIGTIIVWLAILYVVSAIFSYIQGYIMSGIAMKISYQLRKELSEKTNRLPLRYFDSKTHGEILSRVTNDIDTLSNTLSQSLTQMVSSAATLVGVLVMMLSISGIMTLASIMVLPISMLLISIIVKKSQKYFKTQQIFLGHINGHVEEMYGGHQVMKAFNGEKDSIAVFNELNQELYRSGWKSQFLSGLMMPLMGFVGNLGYVVVCILGGILTARGTLKVGSILSFIQYVRSFNQPIQQVASIANVLQSTMAAAERVFEYLEEEEETPDVSRPASVQAIEGQVSFDHVRFGYNEDKVIIHDFSVDIQPGQKVAIVGPTGAGKTTMVKLLMRFYDIQGGHIRIDGTDLRDFARKDERGLFGMVLQDTWLFNGPIRENIRYGCLTASDEQVVEAARNAYADHFIHTLPQGYDMVLNEEASNISQGQKQLLTIARAFLADPKILILDEATSSVDTRTEVLIQKAMTRLMKNRTSFVIAHRLSTIRDADLILVMRDGDIVEQGNHVDLLAAGGFYSDLYNSQFEAQTGT